MRSIRIWVWVAMLGLLILNIVLEAEVLNLKSDLSLVKLDLSSLSDAVSYTQKVLMREGMHL